MMRPRWAAVIARLFVFVWAATAHAECAWVLWATPPDGSFYFPEAGFNGRDDCERSQKTKNLQEQQRFKEEVLRNKVITPEGKVPTEASPPVPSLPPRHGGPARGEGK